MVELGRGRPELGRGGSDQMDLSVAWPLVELDMVTVEDVRALVADLPRSYEVLVRDRIKFRVGRIVYLAFSRDETLMGFGFPKEERQALIASDPKKFMLPPKSDMRYNWAVVRLSEIDRDELGELVLDAWRMVVPKRVARDHLGADQSGLERPP